MEAPRYELSRHAARRVEARGISTAWIAEALQAPDRVEPDVKDPIVQHALKRIAAQDNRVLRVAYNASVTPWRVVSVFFDRRWKGKL